MSCRNVNWFRAKKIDNRFSLIEFEGSCLQFNIDKRTKSMGGWQSINLSVAFFRNQNDVNDLTNRLKLLTFEAYNLENFTSHFVAEELLMSLLVFPPFSLGNVYM